MTEKETLPDGEVSLNALPDEELMSAYAAGSQQAFEILYARHKGVLYRYFLRQLGDERANDCFQNLWLRLIKARDRYEPSGAFLGYLFTVAHNVLMDEHRKSMRNPVYRADELEEDYNGAQVMGLSIDGDLDGAIDGGLDGAIDRDRLRHRLHQLLLTLPFTQREAWVLRQETELSAREIAELTESSEEGVKSRLRYATSKLKAGMARYATRN
ncbi:MAG: sigma-70 family RNA polymerase sigma factor [Gammaproteobacteria bacterium]|nr:sigma-70 family RNA polymerase sigma factor [Gammaproteobacteria bacterium]